MTFIDNYLKLKQFMMKMPAKRFHSKLCGFVIWSLYSFDVRFLSVQRPCAKPYMHTYDGVSKSAIFDDTTIFCIVQSKF